MSIKTFFQMEIPRRSQHCAKGQEQFIAESEYFSVLLENGQGDLLRQDFCAVCWQASNALEGFSRVKGYWKAKIASKKDNSEGQPILSRDEKAFQLLKEALSINSEDCLEEAFVLALYLARRRLIILRQKIRHDNGSEIYLYEVSATEEMLGIKKIELSNLKIEKIQLQLAAKFKLGS